MRKYAFGLATLTFALCGVAFAQVNTINSAKIFAREFNDDPDSILTVVNNYPSLISFDDRDLFDGGFANRHVWRFSSDNGASAFRFSNNSFFDVFMDVNLVGNPVAPRKEAGFLFDTAGGQGQFIVNTDAHEVVAFGGPLPFFAFAANYNSGTTIRMGMTYFRDTDGMRKIIYHAGGVDSPALAFTNNEQGIIDNTTLGGYGQFQIAQGNHDNFGTATFGNIRIVPEPATLAVMGLGLLGLISRHRRK